MKKLTAVLMVVAALAGAGFTAQSLAYDTDRHIERLADRLDLEASQKSEFETIVKAHHEAMKAKREAKREAMKAEMKASHQALEQQLEAVLTEQQMEAFKKMHEKRMERLEQHHEHDKGCFGKGRDGKYHD
jgi:phosphate starvation-inducible protein PhoH